MTSTTGWNVSKELHWQKDSAHWRGKVLTGKFRHWCDEWDGLPIDETCPEWSCGCFPTVSYTRASDPAP